MFVLNGHDGKAPVGAWMVRQMRMSGICFAIGDGFGEYHSSSLQSLFLIRMAFSPSAAANGEISTFHHRFAATCVPKTSLFSYGLCTYARQRCAKKK